jgi:UPF0176 protein
VVEQDAMDSLLVTTFYRFVTLDDPARFQASIRGCCEANDVRGIVLLASEGINATISGPPAGVRAVLGHLQEYPEFEGLSWKESSAETQPFRTLRVRLKREIVTMGVEGIDPARLVGTYVAPEDWNDLISDPEVLVIDTRNDYEVKIGSFQEAINPDIASFRDLPEWLSKFIDVGAQPKVAMFCTGGIRCEKSTALLKEAGVTDVYHLEGGILKYLEEVPESDSLWQGDCFVFDERVSIGHGLALGDHVLCRACRHPLGSAERSSPLYEEGVSCPECHQRTTPEQKARFAERQKQITLARARGEEHLPR